MSPVKKWILLAIIIGASENVEEVFQSAPNVTESGGETITIPQGESIGPTKGERETFTKRIVKSIDKVKNDVMNQRDYNLSKSISGLIDECTPKSDAWSDQKLILLFKFATIMSEIQKSEISWFSDAVEPFIKMTFDDDNHLEEFAHILTVYDHTMLLKYFGKDWNRVNGTEWMYYAYGKILEKSKHLEKQLPYTMMVKVNEFRNAANAHHLLYKASHSNASELENIERFKLDWNLFKGESLSQNAKEMFYLSFAQREVQNLDQKLFTVLGSPLEIQHLARVFCAVRNLSGSNSTKLIEASNINLLPFDLALEKEDNAVIQKLRESLKSECKGSKVLETGLKALLTEMDEFIGNRRINDFASLLFIPSKTIEYHTMFFETVKTKLEKLENATDFIAYVELLEIGTKMARYECDDRTRDILQKLFIAFFTFANRPHLFNDIEQLNQVDELHTALYKQNPYYFNNIKYSANRNGFKNLLNVTFENFNPLTLPKEHDPRQITSAKVLLKFLLFLVNGAYGKRDYPVGSIEYDHKTKIMEYSYALIKFDPDILMKDPSILYEWHQLNGIFGGDIRRFYTRDDVDAFQFVYSPYIVRGNSNADAANYFAAINIAQNLLKFNRSIPSQMLNNILALEKSMGTAETAEEYIRNSFLTEKLYFYEDFSDAIRGIQEKDLKKFVDAKIDLLLSDTLLFTVPPSELSILSSLFTAIKNHKGNAKDLLGEELIEKLKTISEGLQYQKLYSFDETLKSSYEACKEILNI